MARTERDSDRRRRDEKWQTFWCCQDQQRARRMPQVPAEKLEHTGPAEKKKVASVPKREQLASTPEPLLPKGKKESRLSKEPDREEGIQCQRIKEKRIFLRRSTVTVKVKSKVISKSLLKIEARGTFVEAKDRRKRDGLENW